MAVTAMVFGGVGEAAASPAAAAVPGVAPVGPLGPLADLAVRRILLGDLVAAAKFGTTQPIDDPVREKQVLDTVAAESVRLGMAPEPNVRFFRAQIEASKVVQRGLFNRWERYPWQRPTRRPDLAKEVRPQLDLLTTQLLDQLRSTLDLRRPTVTCGVWRIEAEVSADIVHRLDKLHRDAVSVSFRPVCAA
nr:Periplasmic chorismate mutase I precursor [Kibdelosporangium sp. MJ126-NF4]CTQ89264.1 Periplasmic chorismate mutase I precursor (EC 5.4.99.5) [Kibdelosporangium sp. MJ126-NF4]